MSDLSQFELSRVYAKGWSAGRASDLDPAGAGLDAEIEALNPHLPADEKERWAAGFKAALARNEEIGRGRKRPGGLAARNTKP